MNNTRFLIALALAVPMIAACSNDQPTLSEGESGAVPVETVEPTPIEALGTGDDGAEPIIAGQDGTTFAASYVFTFADDLVLPRNDVGFVFRANDSVDTAALDRVAAYFGVDPAAVLNWDEDALTDDAPTVGLGYTATDPMQNWTYFDSDATATLTQCVVNADATQIDDTIADDPGSVSPGAEACVSLEEPPPGVPDAATAEAQMRELLVAVGADPDAVELATYADQFVATVDASELDADGIPTGRTWSLGLGAGGEPYAANGSLAVPQPVGPYPLVGLDVAVARLNGGWAGGAVRLNPADNTDFGSTEFGGTVLEGPNDASEPSGSLPADKPIPVEPGDLAEPPPAEPVHIVAVEPDRVWLWDTNGDAWMVPGYRFIDAADNRWSVPAIGDELLGAPGAPTPTADADDPTADTDG